jgi:hypothetical protein
MTCDVSAPERASGEDARSGLPGAQSKGAQRRISPLLTSSTSSISFTSCVFRTLFTLCAQEFSPNPFLFFQFHTLCQTTGGGTLACGNLPSDRRPWPPSSRFPGHGTRITGHVSAAQPLPLLRVVPCASSVAFWECPAHRFRPCAASKLSASAGSLRPHQPTQ